MNIKNLIIVFLIVIFGTITCASQPQEILTDVNHNIYFPIILWQEALVGAEYEREMCKYKDYINPRSNIKISINWNQVEYEKGTYDWTVPDDKLCRNQPDYIVVKMTPEWAGYPGDPVCKLPQIQYWDEAVAFYRAVVYRYNPRYLAIWNEPDMPVISDGEDYLGCIPDEPESYAEFVNYVVERVDDVKIVAGEVSNVYNEFSRQAFPHLNTEYVSFHCYANFRDVYEPLCENKYQFLQTLVSNKTIINSETAVYYKSGEADDYYQAQVEHFDRLLEMQIPFYFYTGQCHGWPWNTLSTDLLECDEDGNITPRPVWSLYMEQ
jgi:hypothetical protein